jgi:hypothetical protein
MSRAQNFKAQEQAEEAVEDAVVEDAGDDGAVVQPQVQSLEEPVEDAVVEDATDDGKPISDKKKVKPDFQGLAKI